MALAEVAFGVITADTLKGIKAGIQKLIKEKSLDSGSALRSARNDE